MRLNLERSSEAPNGKILMIRRYYRNDLTSGLNDPTIYNRRLGRKNTTYWILKIDVIE